MTTTRCRLLLAALPALIAGAVAAAPPTTIVDLQPARRSDGVVLRDAAGRASSATLTQLNPVINAWLLLTLQSPGRSEMASYHLENADPPGQRIALDAEQPGQLVITRSGVSARCTFWPGNALQEAHRSVLPYAPLCDGRLYLRNTVPGNRSTLEATTEFLRDHVWRGEQIIGFVRREFYPDAFAERATPASAAAELTPAGPPGARVLAGAASQPVTAEGLALDLGQGRAGLVIGRWYGVAGLDGVYASVAQPRALQALPGPALDAVEAEALAYLVAFDLAHFELGFALGTEHPRLGWSARVRDDMRDPALPGPDGIADAAPLVRNGMVGPRLQARTVATFTGGFKREHGAFAHGALAAVNRGSHYGFIEQGVVFSSLVPGLATLFVLDDGEVDMKTWTREDQHLLGRIRHARQNGVPLLERDPRGGAAVPGALLDQWGAGNWSGSADERLRTLRAGACLVDDGTRRFLVYGYFSTATPRAMAQVFLAYGCRYAMHLDMNALEHTYLALYPRSGAQVGVEHLVKGMEVLDKRVHGALVPRFLGFADDRDFFYLVSRKGTR